MRCKRRIRHIVLFLTGCFFFGMISIAAINLFMIGYSKQYTYLTPNAADLSDIDCIMVLGCGVYDNRPTPLLEDRLKRGVEAYNAGVSVKILMSGDHRQTDYDEVNVLQSSPYNPNRLLPAYKMLQR